MIDITRLGVIPAIARLAPFLFPPVRVRVRVRVGRRRSRVGTLRAVALAPVRARALVRIVAQGHLYLAADRVREREGTRRHTPKRHYRHTTSSRARPLALYPSARVPGPGPVLAPAPATALSPPEGVRGE